MASIKSAGFLNPQSTPNDGRAVVLIDKATVSANPTAADTVDFLIPAGFELCKVWLTVPDMDSSTGLTGKVGFLSATGGTTVRTSTSAALSVDDDYFRADGALGQAAALLDLDFAPITFQEDVRLSITWTVAASGTFTAGTIRMVALGNSKGPR